MQMAQAKISGLILQTTGTTESKTIILMFFFSVHVLEAAMASHLGNLGRYGLKGERARDSIRLWA